MNNINLIKPIRPSQQRSLKVWLVISLLTVGITLLFAGMSYLHYDNRLATLEQHKKELTDQIKKLEPAMQEKKTLLDQESDLRGQLEKRISLVDIQENPGIYLHEVARLIPAHTALDSFTREEKKEIIIHGSAKSAQAVTQFLENLNTSKHFSGIKLNVIEPSQTHDQLLRFIMKGKLVIPRRQLQHEIPTAPQPHAYSYIV